MSGLPSEIPNPAGIFAQKVVLWISVITTLVTIGHYVNENGGAMVGSGAITLGLWWIASKIPTKKKFQAGVGSYK